LSDLVCLDAEFGLTEMPKGQTAPQIHEEVMTVAEFCRAVGLSPRSLRDRFRKTTGMSPREYFRQRRMDQARAALLEASSSMTTVTEIATRFGFMELGRFSVDYRELYGEKPSETLRRPAGSR
jgi:AraC-like DNA-binding protein